MNEKMIETSLASLAWESTSIEFGRGLVCGMVAAFQATGGHTYSWAINMIARNLPTGFRRELLTESIRDDAEMAYYAAHTKAAQRGD